MRVLAARALHPNQRLNRGSLNNQVIQDERHTRRPFTRRGVESTEDGCQSFQIVPLTSRGDVQTRRETHMALDTHRIAADHDEGDAVRGQAAEDFLRVEPTRFAAWSLNARRYVWTVR